MGKAKGGRKESISGAGHKDIMFAFRRAGKARKPARLAKGREPAGTARKYLMSVALVPHIPNEFILRGIKHPVQSHRQFHCAKV